MSSQMEIETSTKSKPLKKTTKKASIKRTMTKKPSKKLTTTTTKKMEINPEDYNNALNLVEQVPGSALNNMKNLNDYIPFSKLTQKFRIKFRQDLCDPRVLALIAKKKGWRVLTGDFDQDGLQDIVMIDPRELQIIVFNGHVVSSPGYEAILKYYLDHPTKEQQIEKPLKSVIKSDKYKTANVFKFILEAVKLFANTHDIKRKDIGFLNQVASAVYAGIVFPLFGKDDIVELLKWSHDTKDKNVIVKIFDQVMKTEQARSLVLPIVNDVLSWVPDSKNPMDTVIGMAFMKYPFEFVESMDQLIRGQFSNVVLQTSPVLLQLFDSFVNVARGDIDEYNKLLNSFTQHTMARRNQILKSTGV